MYTILFSLLLFFSPFAFEATRFEWECANAPNICSIYAIKYLRLYLSLKMLQEIRFQFNWDIYSLTYSHNVVKVLLIGVWQLLILRYWHWLCESCIFQVFQVLWFRKSLDNTEMVEQVCLSITIALNEKEKWTNGSKYWQMYWIIRNDWTLVSSFFLYAIIYSRLLFYFGYCYCVLLK